jgi:hypothetical protein
MAVPLRIVTHHDNHPDLSRREKARVLKGSMLAVGVKWAFDLLPEHFQKGPQRAFNFTPRTAAWKKRKRRLFSVGIAVEPDTDLVFRGNLRDQVQYSARRLIRAFPSRCRVSMYGPQYFTLRARSKHTIRLAQEVLAVSQRHKSILGDTADRGLNEELRAVRASRRNRKTTSTS